MSELHKLRGCDNALIGRRISKELLELIFKKYVAIYKHGLMSDRQLDRRQIRKEYYNDFDVCLREFYSHSNITQLGNDVLQVATAPQHQSASDVGDPTSAAANIASSHGSNTGKRKKHHRHKQHKQQLPQQPPLRERSQPPRKTVASRELLCRKDDYHRRLSWNEAPKKSQRQHLFKIYTFRDDETPQVVYSKAKEDCDKDDDDYADDVRAPVHE